MDVVDFSQPRGRHRQRQPVERAVSQKGELALHGLRDLATLLAGGARDPGAHGVDEMQRQPLVMGRRGLRQRLRPVFEDAHLAKASSGALAGAGSRRFRMRLALS